MYTYIFISSNTLFSTKIANDPLDAFLLIHITVLYFLLPTFKYIVIVDKTWQIHAYSLHFKHVPKSCLNLHL